MDKNRRALEIALRQGGVIRLPQALECGIGKGAIKYRLRTGQWTRLRPGLYRIIDMDSPLDRVRAAIVGLPGAIVSHETAAELHNIPTLYRGLAVVSVHTQTTHFFPDVTIHRTHDVADEDIVELKELPVTSLPRTVVDMAAFLKPDHTASILDDLITSKRLRFDAFESVALRVARRGKPGSAALRKIIEQRTGVAANASQLEREGLALIRAAGLPDPVLEYPIPWNPDRRFDAAYPDRRLAIEWDSRRWHTQVDAFDRDRQRDRDAVIHGWRILRFTWNDVEDRSGDVIQTLRLAFSLPASG